MLRPNPEFVLIWKWMAIRKRIFLFRMGKNYGISLNLGEL
jgi:hypothetical protein